MSRDDGAAPRQVVVGIGAMVAAIALFSVMDVIIKGLRADYGTVQIFFFRSLFALIPAYVVIRGEGGLATMTTRRLPLQVFRSVLIIAFLICLFYALKLLPLADAYAITFAAPLFITALGVPMLGEAVGRRRWAAIVVGLIGVLAILRPGGGLLSAGGLIVFAGTLCYSLGMIYTRQLSRTERNGVIVMYFTLTSTILSAVALPFGWVWPTAGDWLLLATLGLIGGVGQVFITQAFRSAPAAIASPFQYTSILWGVAFGYLFFDDAPDAIMLAGAAIVVASGLYILYRETRGERPTGRATTNTKDR